MKLKYYTGRHAAQEVEDDQPSNEKHIGQTSEEKRFNEDYW